MLDEALKTIIAGNCKGGEAMNQTTGFAVMREDDVRLTGTEWWPLIGWAMTKRQAQEIIRQCAGLKRWWNCLEKAKIAREVLQGGEVVIGSLMVVSGDGKSEYGYYFHPPFEFHAWLQQGDIVVDVALPGVIEKGLQTRDVVGPFLVGREPKILAGKPMKWMKYQTCQVLEEG